ncbi:cryptochrome/DNA photolyase family protein [Crateriforma conspicua]|uniref:deoxyribodipyrimidine photolyase n=1 Tax=Crateriforma conspicua TaxID=2527996 RepID=UPI00118B18B3|nr:deoxyribodipyrimidine photolyase [Crateriforma conspicua]QDV61321.1 Deoxyribodipyrimidine photo-lyase [Crateriforma conspicua]
MSIPPIRHRHVNEHPVRKDGDYVLYWMIAFRRTGWNFSLQHAVDRANQLGKPLLIFEPLRTRYRWASDRLHRFVIEGMADNAANCQRQGVAYFPYVEPAPGRGTPLLHRLAKRACTVVTDQYPCFFLPDMIRAVKDRIPARLEQVDSNGVIPLAQPDRFFTVAHSYRRWMQKNVIDSLLAMPREQPLTDLQNKQADADSLLPAGVKRRWKAADLTALLGDGGLAEIPIDHDVRPSPTVRGGSVEANRRLDTFLKQRLSDYDELRNHPDEHATTGLSAHLHFGHIAAHQVVQAILDHESWTPDQAGAANGKNHGFWNTSPPAEALLDQILTWREIGFNQAYQRPQTYDRLESLPDWAQKTIAETRSDPRPYLYTLKQFENAQTHDELWNAAQRELVETGLMHNYMRMLWGKKILHWTENAQQALDFMIHLNNKYGLDGRDPNSYCGILWVLGRTDRAWGPKRPVFGSIRYMTSDSTRRKLRLGKYLQRFGD